jgi:nanoRNase/pAp phosphatase (c-di-AMP/oligoRNAs hydrolase)
MYTIDKIVKIVEDSKDIQGREVFIQGHNFPDADAIASAYGMKMLLNHRGIDSDIIYVGKIEKLTISRMIETLDIKIILDEDEERLSEDDYIIIVDAQKFNSNIKDCTGDEVICIDHHPVSNTPEYKFHDIRPDVGACSSIIASYFFEAGIVPDKITATALIYGIKMDTLDLRRGTSAFDVEMFSRLFPLADSEILRLMQSNTMKFDDLTAYGEAIKNIQIFDNVGIARLDVHCPDGLLGEISDFILDLNEVRLCVVYVVRENGVKLSVRSEIPAISAGAAVETALDGIGAGGGHAEMAGGFIPYENVKLIENLDDEIRGRFLRVFSLE